MVLTKARDADPEELGAPVFRPAQRITRICFAGTTILQIGTDMFGMATGIS